MRRGGIIGLLIAIAFLAPYTVSRYLEFAMGPWTGMAVSHDGTVSTITSNIAMPPPAWPVKAPASPPIKPAAASSISTVTPPPATARTR